jgi:GxxExxY protein
MRTRRCGDSETRRRKKKEKEKDMKSRDSRNRSDAISPELDALTEAIIAALIEVHRELGPGLAEKLYESAVCHEFDLRGIPYERQVRVPVCYKGKLIGETIIDLVVAKKVVLELKACESLNPVHRAQTACYLHLLNLRVGLLVNFNVAILVDGIKRVVVPAKQ